MVSLADDPNRDVPAFAPMVPYRLTGETMGMNSALLKMIEDAEAHERARQERIAALVALCEELTDNYAALLDDVYEGRAAASIANYRARLAQLKGEG